MAHFDFDEKSLRSKLDESFAKESFSFDELVKEKVITSLFGDTTSEKLSTNKSGSFTTVFILIGVSLFFTFGGYFYSKFMEEKFDNK